MSELSTAFTRLRWCWLELVGSDPAITPFTFRVAFALSSFCNHASGLAWPKHEKIAELVAGTRGGVKSAIRNLINAGYLVCDEAHGRYATNTYAMARPENGHGRDRLFPANRPPATENGHGHDENGHDHRKNGHGHDEKGSQPSPQNTTKNSSMNSVMNSDRSLRSRDKNTSNLESAKKSSRLKSKPPRSVRTEGASSLKLQPSLDGIGFTSFHPSN
jgi:hypothetical protein